MPVETAEQLYPGDLQSIDTPMLGRIMTRAHTWRWSARSALLPVNAMIMFGFPCRCSSFTHVFAFAKLSALLMSNTMTAAAAPLPAQHMVRHGLTRVRFAT